MPTFYETKSSSSRSILWCSDLYDVKHSGKCMSIVNTIITINTTVVVIWNYSVLCSLHCVKSLERVLWCEYYYYVHLYKRRNWSTKILRLTQYFTARKWQGLHLNPGGPAVNRCCGIMLHGISLHRIQDKWGTWSSQWALLPGSLNNHQTRPHAFAYTRTGLLTRQNMCSLMTGRAL